ncbi:pitrilysin family protein [Fusibacter bizertensis]|uniref:Pitrilysin family protein n=1 Tax=Fusibacter bizertensis TaxID=1488331 RepID=A0ABT6N854_9FIRM|nr:pitrilysin family protein [Fusibacter bizertensis]MDH8676578.1 pitrilysin family protein [Fusibacter bizertensis]
MHNKVQLDNGLTVVYEKLEGYKSISIGIWVKTGSAFENEDNNGISHFIEHMLFKGTKNRSAKEIASLIDGIGGEINAYTAKECTCFYTKTLSLDFEVGLDILSDMILNSTFNAEHIETEKTVIIDEINMYEDAAEEMVIDLINEITFKDHPLSYPILGTKKTVNSFNHHMIRAYFDTYYVAENMVISIAGDFDEVDLLEKVDYYFKSLKKSTSPLQDHRINPTYNWGVESRKKDFEQIQVAVNFPGIKFDHELSYEMMVLNNILGGTNSSRLFQSIREDRGLVYSIYSEPNFYDALGTLCISFGVSKENLKETLMLVADEINKIKLHRISNEAMEHAKNHLRGSFFLNLEGSDNYMDMIGRIELFAHREKNIDDMLYKISNIQLDGVLELIGSCLDTSQIALAIVGDIEAQETTLLYEEFCKVLKSK